jgi:PAS domain S-box-containing protein
LTSTRDIHAAFLSGGGALGELIAAHDWSLSLGPIAGWPQSLKTTVGLMLHSPVPLVLLWGADGIMIYNDAYSGFAGNRHPGLLGSKVLEGWPEAADLNAHVMATCMAGGTLRYKDERLVLNRRGHPEEAWMDLFYSPVIDESGKTGGVIAVVVETTERVLTERRAVAERERLAQLFQDAPSFMCQMDGPQHVFTFTNAAYQQLIAHRNVIGRTVREALPEIAGQGFFELLDRVYATGESYRGNAVPVTLQRTPDAPLEERLLDFIYQPVRDAAGTITGIFSEGYDVTQSRRVETRRAALIELGDLIRDTDDPDELAYGAAEILGRALDVNRAGYGTVDPARETITIVRDWNAPGTASLAGTLNFRDYGSYIDDLKRGETVVITDARTDPRAQDTAAALEAISARSFVNMPVSEQGGLVALLYLNSAAAREWSGEEIAFIREVAERTRTAVERRRTQLALAASQQRLQLALDAASMGSFAWRPGDDVAEGDARMMALFGLPPDGLLTLRTALAHSIDPRDGPGYAAAVARACDPAGDGMLREDIRVRLPDGSLRWLSITGQVTFNEPGGPLMAGAARDITESREAEARLRESEA